MKVDIGGLCNDAEDDLMPVMNADAGPAVENGSGMSLPMPLQHAGATMLDDDDPMTELVAATDTSRPVFVDVMMTGSFSNMLDLMYVFL